MTTQFAARPTLYRGVLMRSRLEARAAAFFDAAGVPWEHEPHAFRGSAGEYLPDFRLSNGDWEVYVEVKPWPESPEDWDAVTPYMDRAMTVMTEAAKELWVLFSNGFSAPLTGPSTDRGRGGMTFICPRCSGITIRLRVPPRPCVKCGGPMTGASHWLGYTAAPA